MPTKKEAQKEARVLRKTHKNLTVNTKEISKGNFGNRFSPKGKRDKYSI
jgi:hypothetical protein